MQAYSLLTPLLISPSGFSLNYSESLFRMAYILSVPLQFGNQNVNVLAPVFLPFFFFLSLWSDLGQSALSGSVWLLCVCKRTDTRLSFLPFARCVVQWMRSPLSVLWHLPALCISEISLITPQE